MDSFIVGLPVSSLTGSAVAVIKKYFNVPWTACSAGISGSILTATGRYVLMKYQQMAFSRQKWHSGYLRDTTEGSVIALPDSGECPSWFLYQYTWTIL